MANARAGLRLSGEASSSGRTGGSVSVASGGGSRSRAAAVAAESVGWQSNRSFTRRQGRGRGRGRGVAQVDAIATPFNVNKRSDSDAASRPVGWDKTLGLACVGFLWSASTMMVTSLLPVFMRQELGASNLSIGLLEGVATLLNTAAKVMSGIVSDLIGNRGRVIAVGSILTAMVKLLFASVTTVGGVFLARSCDRLAKGIRMAPIDALLSDISPPEYRSRTYGVYYSMMTMGGMCGALWGAAVMYASGDNFRLTFMLATVPALAATLLLEFVTDLRQTTPKAPTTTTAAAAAAAAAGVALGPVAPTDVATQKAAQLLAKIRALPQICNEKVAELPVQFWRSLAVFTVLMVARFSEAFVFLRASSVGVPFAAIPVFAMANNLVQASLAYPIGCLGDSADRKTLVLVGFCVLALADVVLICAATPGGVLAGFCLTGLHMALTHSNMKAMMSATIPPHLRGTGFAVMAIAAGCSLAGGNLLAGLLSDCLGSTGAFYSGLGAVVLATALGVVLL